jgi:hypothetical protein
VAKLQRNDHATRRLVISCTRTAAKCRRRAPDATKGLDGDSDWLQGCPIVSAQCPWVTRRDVAPAPHPACEAPQAAAGK